MPEDTMTAVQWLRAFAQDLENSQIASYETVQILRRIAKHVDELLQCNRDAVRFSGEGQILLNKIIAIYEERETSFERIIALQEEQLEIGRIRQYGR